MKDRDRYPKRIEYEDELKDEFSLAQITPRRIGDDYVYIHTSLWKRLTHFFWYRLVAKPLARLFLKCKFGHRVIGRDKFRACRKSGFFLYGNHTQPTGDAVMAGVICRPLDAYVIVHPNNVSMPFLGRVTPSMGALPLPDTLGAAKKFSKALEYHAQAGHVIMIYPEAHIWPYYTKIRPFGSETFKYPARLKKPVFCLTNTYQKKKNPERFRLVTYVDGPFYPDPDLSVPAAALKLREEVYACMCERAKMSDFELIAYRKKETPGPDAQSGSGAEQK
ncbi:MAG: hypothetical protein IJU20_08265 [Clostridia bacterium]|nr:hypothetical protein [Clostridia bacterium]